MRDASGNQSLGKGDWKHTDIKILEKRWKESIFRFFTVLFWMICACLLYSIFRRISKRTVQWLAGRN